MNTNTLLSNIENHLKTAGAKALGALLPGITEEQVNSATKAVGIELPKPALELFKWHNGVDTTAGFRNTKFFSFFTLLPIAECVERYQYSALEEKFWPKQFFLMATSGGGDDLLINTKEDDPNYGKLYVYSPPLNVGTDVVAKYESIDSLLVTTISCYEQGAYTFNNGKLEVDFDVEFRIGTKLNPTCSYWADSE